MKVIKFEVLIKVDNLYTVCTISKEELQQYACNKIREEHPKAINISAYEIVLEAKL